jgi:tetratricopeptide (TPR) repeat protein
VGSGRPRGRLNGVDVKAEVLRHARRRAGLSLAQVAGSELTRQAVHLIETGKVRPSMNSLRVITSRLAVPMHSVLVEADAAIRQDEPVEELEALVREQYYDRALERGAEILQSALSPSVVASVHHYLGHALYRLGHPWKAMDRLTLALDLFNSGGASSSVVKTMELQARALHLAEDERALAVAEEALERCLALDPPEPRTKSALLELIGAILAARGDHVGARSRYDEALEAAGSVRDLAQMARIYHNLGFCYLRVGDLGRAIDLVLKAETLYEAEQRISGAPPNLDLPRVENDLGMLLMEQGDLVRAGQRIESALQRLSDLGVYRLRSHFLLSLAEVRHHQGRLADGVLLVEDAIGLARRLNETRALATGYKQLGELHAAQEEPDLAVRDFQRALAIMEEAGWDERRDDCLRAYERALGRRYQADAAAGA